MFRKEWGSVVVVIVLFLTTRLSVSGLVDSTPVSRGSLSHPPVTLIYTQGYR